MAATTTFQSNVLRILIFIILMIRDSQQQDLRINKRQSTCSCGAVNRRTRIVGGQETEVNEYPWMVMIRQFAEGAFGVASMDLCGAALIDRWYLVTAAHCFNGVSNISQLLAYIGDHNLRTSTDTNSVNRTISKLTIHPNYNNRSQANDIAIITLSAPVNYQSNIQPICIPPPGLDMTGQELTVTGWGSVEAGGPGSDVLLEVTLPVINNKDCKNMYNGTVAVIDQSVLCAGLPDGSKDACQGDSGGPGIFFCDGRYSLAGVVSFGIGCGNPRYPGVFTNVSNFRNWIIQNTPGAQLCGSNCYPAAPQYTDCGWANNSPPRAKRIVGGSVTTANKYPWMVSVYILITDDFGNSQWDFACGATVIGKDWLLTSARCVSGVNLNNIFFVVGDYNLNNVNEPGEQEVFAAAITPHPQYNTPFLANDIAVVKLTQSLTFSSFVFPICIPSLNIIAANFSNTWTTLSGWGRTSTGGPYATQLKEAPLYAISNSECRNYYGTVIQDTMVCTASSAQGDACEGDNGGPLMMQGRTGRYYEVGTQSFRHSDGCGAGKPSGNTRVALYATWIQQVTGVKPPSNSDVLPAFRR